MSTYNIYIILPGTTGSTLVDGLHGYTPLAPIWPDQVVAEELAPLFGPKPAAGMLESSLYPGIVCGWNTSGSGYASLAAAISTAADAKPVSAESPFTDITTQPVNTWGLPNLSNSIPSSLDNALVIGFAYDWRQDNTTSAKMLQNLLYNINRYENVGQIFLIGHSMGGIVARTYLESVGQSDPWYSKIQSLITLGTPHLGAPLALQAINGTLDITTYMGNLTLAGLPLPAGGFDTMVWDFVDNNYGDSTFELLPPPVVNKMPMDVQAYVQFIQDQSLSSVASYDIFSFSSSNGSDIWKALQNEVATPDTGSDIATNLANAGTLLSTLANAAYGATNLPPYYCIYGLSCVYPTSVGSVYVGGTSQPWYSIDAVQGGDQIVPEWSASFSVDGSPAKATYRARQAPSGDNTPLGSVNHMQLPGSPDAHQQIISWLNLSS